MENYFGKFIVVSHFSKVEKGYGETGTFTDVGIFFNKET